MSDKGETMKVHFFPHKPEFKIGYYKMWSIGSLFPTVTEYCFNIFGSTIMFTREGIK